jgi:hypothetical protein
LLSSEGPPVLSLRELTDGLPGLTSEAGTALAQAAAVCLFEHEHTQGVHLPVTGTHPYRFRLYWPSPVTDQMLATWRDPNEKTERGACAVAILLVLRLTDFTILERSWRGTGYDYGLAKKGDSDRLPFTNAARLEVSGISNGNEATILERARRKQRQTLQSAQTGLPAVVVVVEFGQPASHLQIL